MRIRSTVLFPALLLTAALPVLAAPHARRGPTSQHFSKKSTAKPKSVAQRGIDSDRTNQIQTALIAHGYMTGEPTGTWTPETQEALRKFQSDNGWQTKMVPDSRAIIKLGLGPAASSPEGAAVATSLPIPESSEPESPIPTQQ